jgi:hypothetical protein
MASAINFKGGVSDVRIERYAVLGESSGKQLGFVGNSNIGAYGVLYGMGVVGCDGHSPGSIRRTPDLIN